MSLRLRVTLLALVALVLGLLAGGVVVPVLVERFLTDRLDEQLHSVASPALRAIADPGFVPFGPRDGSEGRYGPTSVYVEVRDGTDATAAAEFLDGSDMANAPDLPARLASDPGPGRIFTTSGLDRGRYRVLVTSGPPGSDLTFIVALPLTEVDATVRRVIIIEVVTITVAVIGVAALDVVADRRGPAPAAADGGHGPDHRRDGRARPGPADRPRIDAHRARAAGGDAQHDARPDRRVLRRPAGL